MFYYNAIRYNQFSDGLKCFSFIILPIFILIIVIIMIIPQRYMHGVFFLFHNYLNTIIILNNLIAIPIQ